MQPYINVQSHQLWAQKLFYFKAKQVLFKQPSHCVSEMLASKQTVQSSGTRHRNSRFQNSGLARISCNDVGGQEALAIESSLQLVIFS